MPKGMLVFTLRSASGDCTNHGVTSRYTGFVLIGDGVPEIFEPSDRYPALYLFVRHGGSTGAIPEPPDQKGPGHFTVPSGAWYMFGGNYVDLGDSRLKDINHGLPIPVHDRVEP